MRKHVYQDEDGEASTDVPEGTQDLASRTSISILALVVLGLSALNWALLDMDMHFGLITSGWVRSIDFSASISDTETDRREC